MFFVPIHVTKYVHPGAMRKHTTKPESRVEFQVSTEGTPGGGRLGVSVSLSHVQTATPVRLLLTRLRERQYTSETRVGTGKEHVTQATRHAHTHIHTRLHLHTVKHLCAHMWYCKLSAWKNCVTKQNASTQGHEPCTRTQNICTYDHTYTGNFVCGRAHAHTQTSRHIHTRAQNIYTIYTRHKWYSHARGAGIALSIPVVVWWWWVVVLVVGVIGVGCVFPGTDTLT